MRIRIQLLYHHSRIAGSNGVGRNIFGYHRTGPDDAVFTDGHPFADDCAISDPHIIVNPNRQADPR